MPEFPAGSVRKPPPLQSILRLQRTVGNRAAQRILRIGDGYRPDPLPSPEAPPAPRFRLRTNRRRLAAVLVALLAIAIALWARIRWQ